MEQIIKRHIWSALPPVKVKISAEYKNAAEGIRLGAAVKVLIGKAKDAGTLVDLREALLDGLHLNHASLNHASLNHASLNDASLNGASLNDASLNDASLNDASLNHASLNHASLNRTSLNHASLNHASLNHASLNDASLNGASLNHASLNRTSLNRTSLNGAKNIGEFIMSDGLKFSEYLRDVVPQLLAAGGKTWTESELADAWQCHVWDRAGCPACPMAMAFSVTTLEKIPALYRSRAKEFIQFFDAGIIPCPAVSTPTEPKADAAE